VAINEKTLGPNDPNLVSNLRNLAGVYYQEHKYTSAEPLFQRVLEFQEKKLGPNHPDLVSDLTYVAAVYLHEKRYADAEPLLKRAVAIEEKTPDKADLPTILGNLAFVLRKEGRDPEAATYERQADKLRGTKSKPDTPRK